MIIIIKLTCLVMIYENDDQNACLYTEWVKFIKIIKLLLILN